ncbi:hypothetical protein HYT05_03235 [Candidatus Kaiserbacteria bacterium]|nr:hypothetical protein [Candidatus Kaiserbacteria bacterium]
MKICFFLHRRFTQLGHAMACHIRREYPDTEFCAYVGTRQSLAWLEGQTNIAYTGLLLDEDVHLRLHDEKIDYAYLRWLENEYGIPNLWPYLYIDRVVMNGQLVREYPYDVPSLSREDMLRKLQVQARAIIAFLDEQKPDVVVTAVIGSVGSMLLYHIAKKRGIRTIHTEFARIGNRIAFSENYRTFTWVKERFAEIRAGSSSPERAEAERFVHEFREAPTHYDEDTLPEFYGRRGRSSHLRFLLPKNLAHSIAWYASVVSKHALRRGMHDYTETLVWWEMWDKLRRKVRGLIGFDDLYSPFDPTTRFAYYPLHIDPEIATLLLGPYYTNQLELIRATARSLPIDMLLYVKEHPGMVGFRTRRYYQEILRIPNVRLLPPSVSGLTLAGTAALTVTITSTNAWESIILKKPVITFGDVFFNDIPGVVRCHGWEEFPYLVKKQLEEWQHDEEALLQYVSALLEDSVVVDFSALWNRGASAEEVMRDEGMQALSRKLAEKAGLAARI